MSQFGNLNKIEDQIHEKHSHNGNLNKIEDQIHEKHPHNGDWLCAIVFGLNDGLVTTLVFIMAITGIASTHLIGIVLGEILAGGVSMTLGAYLSARTTAEILEQRIATEEYEIIYEPEEERAELRAIYKNKGMNDPLLKMVIDHLTANTDRWLQAMVHDELGVIENQMPRPYLHGLQIGLSFIIGGLIPAIPLFLALPDTRWWSYAFTAITSLVLGIIKSRYTCKGSLQAGFEFLGIVTIGTIVGVSISFILHVV